MNSKKPYDLDERTFIFARDVALLVNRLPHTLPNIEYSKQLIRSSASVGANYIEANENLGEKDALFRFKICRKEAKESAYWLRLIMATMNDRTNNEEIDTLILEANELKLILSSIINKKKSI